MSHRVWPELCLILSSFAAAGGVAAQQPSSNTAADAQAQQSTAAVGQTQQPAAQASAKSDSSASTATPVPPPATPAAPPPPAGPSADLIKQARSTGFKVKGTGEQTRFCKREARIGTNIVTENCMNEDQFQGYLQRTEQDRNDMMRMQGGCSAPGCVHN